MKSRTLVWFAGAVAALALSGIGYAAAEGRSGGGDGRRGRWMGRRGAVQQDGQRAEGRKPGVGRSHDGKSGVESKRGGQSCPKGAFRKGGRGHGFGRMQRGGKGFGGMRGRGGKGFGGMRRGGGRFGGRGGAGKPGGRGGSEKSGATGVGMRA